MRIALISTSLLILFTDGVYSQKRTVSDKWELYGDDKMILLVYPTGRDRDLTFSAIFKIDDLDDTILPTESKYSQLFADTFYEKMRDYVPEGQQQFVITNYVSGYQILENKLAEVHENINLELKGEPINEFHISSANSVNNESGYYDQWWNNLEIKTIQDINDHLDAAQQLATNPSSLTYKSTVLPRIEFNNQVLRDIVDGKIDDYRKFTYASALRILPKKTADQQIREDILHLYIRLSNNECGSTTATASTQRSYSLFYDDGQGNKSLVFVSDPYWVPDILDTHVDSEGIAKPKFGSLLAEDMNRLISVCGCGSIQLATFEQNLMQSFRKGRIE